MTLFRRLCGYRHDSAAIRQVAAQNGSIRQVASHLMGGSEPKNVFLWRPLLKVKPSWRRGAQGLGDCFTAGTKVTMASGDLKNIEDVVTGDFVISGLGRACRVLSVLHKPHAEYQMSHLETADTELDLTVDHLIPSIDRNGKRDWRPAGELEAGFEVLQYSKVVVNGVVRYIEKPSKLTESRRYSMTGKVFCIEVEGDQSFLANGVVSHNCTSWGVELACTSLMATQDVSGQGKFIAEAATESIYGGARVECAGGNTGGSRPAGNQDGSVPAWAALFVKTYGVALRLDYSQDTKKPEHDLRVYSGQKAKVWGNYGCGGKNDKLMDDICKEHPVGQIAQVFNISEAVATLSGGYGFTCGSNAGFGQMRRDANGICRWVDTWGHQMCLKPGAKILGETVKDIEDVVIGDMVLSSDGKYHKVTKLFVNQFNGNMVRIKPTCAEAIDTTPTHPVLVYRKTHLLKYSTTLEHDITELPEIYRCCQGITYRPVWVPACEVQIGDFMISPGLAAQTAYDIDLPMIDSPRASKPVKTPKLNAELAYMFGFYVGDGNIKKGHGIGFTLSLKDDVDRICQAVRQFGVEPRVRRFNKFVRIHVDSTTLEASFREWFGTDSHTKKFPNWLCNSRYIQQVVEGYVDADGCRYKGRVQIVTTSATVVQQLRLMLVTLGEAPNFYIKDNTCGTYANSTKTWEGVWFPTGTKNCVKHLGHVNLHKVKSTLLLPYSGPVHNIEVDGTHDYVADGFALHNCVLGLRWRKGKPEFRMFQSWGDCCSGPDPGIEESIQDIWRPHPQAVAAARRGQPLFLKPNLPWQNFPAIAEMTAEAWNPISATSWWVVEEDMARILSTGDCWTYSDIQGFKKRDLNLIGANASWLTGSW